jgi:hypothetical protein
VHQDSLLDQQHGRSNDHEENRHRSTDQRKTQENDARGYNQAQIDHGPDDLGQRLLEVGPGDLSTEERNALLWDADAMMALHKELWVCPASNLDEWWQQALRHHNEVLAMASRRSMT